MFYFFLNHFNIKYQNLKLLRLTVCYRYIERIRAAIRHINHVFQIYSLYGVLFENDIPY